MSTITIETPVKPPGAVDAGAGGEGEANIFVSLKLPGADDKSFIPGVILRCSFAMRFEWEGISVRELRAIGTLSNALAHIVVNRADLLPAIVAIRYILGQFKDWPSYSAIFFFDGSEGDFRIAHYGTGLGAPVTLTFAALQAELAEIARLAHEAGGGGNPHQELIEALLKLNPPPDEPPQPGAGAGPAA